MVTAFQNDAEEVGIPSHQAANGLYETTNTIFTAAFAFSL
jgi:hypothetical protein